MRLRVRHLACLVLLLSSLNGAQASRLHSGDYGLGGHYISVLLAACDHAGIATEASPAPRNRDLTHFGLPVTAVAQHRAIWATRPPAAHSLALQAATAFAI